MTDRTLEHRWIPILAALGAIWFATATPVRAPEQSPPSKEATPQAEQTPQAELPKPLVIPEAEKNRKNPVPMVKEAVEAGRVTFASQCAMCHGPKGDGKGDLTAALKLKVPDLANPTVQKKRTDGEWFYIISTGHGQMPGEQRLTPENKWEMINFMRSLLHPLKPEQ